MIHEKATEMAESDTAYYTYYFRRKWGFNPHLLCSIIRIPNEHTATEVRAPPRFLGHPPDMIFTVEQESGLTPQ